MPQLGESVAEGTVTQWHVKEGDHVTREQPLLEVATDKADSEVPSPCNGIITRLAAAEGDIIATGGLLCVIDDSAAGASPNASAAASEQAAAPAARVSSPKASPATRKLAREEGVDLEQLEGTGERGRITADDVKRASEGPPSAAPSIPTPPPSTIGHYDAPRPSPPARPSPQLNELREMMNEQPVPGIGFRSYKVPPFSPGPGDQIVPFSRRRRITADHMLYSQAVSPHVVTVAEIDLAKIARLRDQHKADFKREGTPLTYLTFVVAAIVKALREHPTLNARVLEDSYAILKDINVGIAVDTPGGLLVANIKRTDTLSLRGIAASIYELASRARGGKVTADDLRGTTFTVSNPGRKGNLFGGAIISQPNVAILRIGEIKKRPVVVTVNGEDHIAIHPVMYTALSYDHRIIDGVEANSFLWRISEILNKAEVEL